MCNFVLYQFPGREKLIVCKRPFFITKRDERQSKAKQSKERRKEEGRKGGREEGRKGGREEGRKGGTERRKEEEREGGRETKYRAKIERNV